jgi:hypothetical protein
MFIIYKLFLTLQFIYYDNNMTAILEFIHIFFHSKSRHLIRYRWQEVNNHLSNRLFIDI